MTTYLFVGGSFHGKLVDVAQPGCLFKVLEPSSYEEEMTFMYPDFTGDCDPVDSYLRHVNEVRTKTYVPRKFSYGKAIRFAYVLEDLGEKEAKHLLCDAIVREWFGEL